MQSDPIINNPKIILQKSVKSIKCNQNLIAVNNLSTQDEIDKIEIPMQLKVNRTNRQSTAKRIKKNLKKTTYKKSVKNLNVTSSCCML